MHTRTTWREKLEKPQEPKVIRIPATMQKRFGTGTMLIARPLDVDARIRQVPGAASSPNLRSVKTWPATPAEAAAEGLGNGKKLRPRS